MNILGGLGSDFPASGHFVGLVGGAGVLMGGIVGCLIFPLIDRLLPLRYLYLAIGVVGSLFTLALILLPRTPTTFALALIGENVFQSVAIVASTAIAFETIGPSNPLAATNYCLMVRRSTSPIPTWWSWTAGDMLARSGRKLHHGAGVSLVACLLLVTLLVWGITAPQGGDLAASDAGELATAARDANAQPPVSLANSIPAREVLNTHLEQVTLTPVHHKPKFELLYIASPLTRRPPSTRN